jgi:hypothetical protein
MITLSNIYNYSTYTFTYHLDIQACIKIFKYSASDIGAAYFFNGGEVFKLSMRLGSRSFSKLSEYLIQYQ